MTRQIAISNAYETVAASGKYRERIALPNDMSSENENPFLLPFIPDELSIAIRRYLIRADLENNVYAKHKIANLPQR